MTLKIELNKIGAEDLLLGTSVVEQTRNGSLVQVTSLNASNIPFNSQYTISEVIADKATLDEYKTLKSEVETVIDTLESITDDLPVKWKDYIDNGVHPYRPKGYPKGSIVYVNGDHYFCPEDIPIEEFSDKWFKLRDTYTGSWEVLQNYNEGDIVSFDDSIYIALKDSTGEIPKESTEYWVSSFVPTGIQLWRSSRTYNTGDPVYNNNYNIYLSSIDGNINIDPNIDTSDKWVIKGKTENTNGFNTGDIKLKLIRIADVPKLENGWLVLNGAEVSRDTYHELFSYFNSPEFMLPQSEWDAIDNKKVLFGDGDGSTTFTLPDYTLYGGHFRSYTAKKTISEYQTDMIRNIKGRIDVNAGVLPPGAEGVFKASPRLNDLWSKLSTAVGSGSFYFDASTQVPTGSENQPYGICLVPLIKY